MKESGCLLNDMADTVSVLIQIFTNAIFDFAALSGGKTVWELLEGEHSDGLNREGTTKTRPGDLVTPDPIG